MVRWSTRSPTTRRRRRSTPRSQAALAADADAIALIGFDETSRLLVALVEAGLGPQDIPTYLVDGNIGNPLGERFDAGE